MPAPTPNLSQENSRMEWIETKRDAETGRVEFGANGLIGNGCQMDNAHNLIMGEKRNGSGPKAFGGAKTWPFLSLEVSFQVGEEGYREDLAEVLKRTVDEYFSDIRRKENRRP